MRGVRNSISELLRNVQLTVSLMASFSAEPQPFKYLQEQNRYPGKQMALTVNTYVEVSFFFPSRTRFPQKKKLQRQIPTPRLNAMRFYTIVPFFPTSDPVLLRKGLNGKENKAKGKKRNKSIVRIV